MPVDLPKDADGDALGRLAATGSDLTQPMGIDFHVALPNEEMGVDFAKLAELSGFHAELWQDPEDKSWTCTCSRTMVPIYKDILEVQERLDELGCPFGAKTDGWGSFGNHSQEEQA